MAGFIPAEYETVDARLHRFWDDLRAAKLFATIETELLEIARDTDGKPLQYVVRTTVVISDGRRATGLAEETVGTSPVNRTSALENAETSSTGRALAQLGYSPKGARPSAEEMQKAQRQVKPLAKPKAVKEAPAEVVADVLADADPADHADPKQWAALVAKYGSKSAVVRKAHEVFEVVTRDTDITYLQAEELLAS